MFGRKRRIDVFEPTDGVTSPAAPHLFAIDAVPADPKPRTGTIHLFPGLEREDFEVGLRTGAGPSSLVLRWKDGGEWFSLPPLFNRAVLSALDEREAGGELTQLMRSFGYELE